MNQLKSPSAAPLVRPSSAPPETARVSANASLNFSVAKVIAILTVMAGHWFTGTILWIPVTFGLFVFAFSSAYFTARIYGVAIDRGHFWRKKLERLGLRYWVILGFLAVVVAFKGGTVLHWHTLVHFLGVSGAMNWLLIPNRSGLGAGLWFFTLLLLFYISYPYLAKLCQSKANASVFAIAATVGAVYLETTHKVGHELWLTALGFFLGVVFGMHETGMRARTAAVLFMVACGTLFGLNLLSGQKQFNTVLIAAASIALSLWLAVATPILRTVAAIIARLEKYLLEIFLIHTYLFIHLSGNSGLDFLASLLLVVLAAMSLNWVVEVMSARLFERKRADRRAIAASAADK